MVFRQGFGGTERPLGDEHLAFEYFLENHFDQLTDFEYLKALYDGCGISLTDAQIARMNELYSVAWEELNLGVGIDRISDALEKGLSEFFDIDATTRDPSKRFVPRRPKGRSGLGRMAAWADQKVSRGLEQWKVSNKARHRGARIARGRAQRAAARMSKNGNAAGAARARARASFHDRKARALKIEKAGVRVLRQRHADLGIDVAGSAASAAASAYFSYRRGHVSGEDSLVSVVTDGGTAYLEQTGYQLAFEMGKEALVQFVPKVGEKIPGFGVVYSAVGVAAPVVTCSTWGGAAVKSSLAAANTGLSLLSGILGGMALGPPGAIGGAAGATYANQWINHKVLEGLRSVGMLPNELLPEYAALAPKRAALKAFVPGQSGGGGR